MNQINGAAFNLVALYSTRKRRFDGSMITLPSWVWPVAISPFVGSFLGVLVMRADRPLAIVIGRSACATCAAKLEARDLVPFVSWLASGGRCRHCSAPLGAFYPAIEAAAMAVAVWSALTVPGWIVWAGCVLGWALLTLAVTDFKFYMLPDFLTLPLIPAGLFVAWMADPAALPGALIGTVCGFVFVIVLRWIYFAVRGREGMGFGDAKLLAAAGAWVSWIGLPSVVLIAAIAGLMLALLRAARTGTLEPMDRVPFGAFLCLGTWIVWLYGPLQVG